jgi:hypothetical protein
MKKKWVLGGLLVLGLVLAACTEAEDGPHITVYGGSFPPKVGETLRAFSSGAEFTGDSDFIWEFSDKRQDSPWYEILVNPPYYGYYGTVSQENDKDFTIGTWLANLYLRARRKTKTTDSIQGGWVYSEIIGRIQTAG